MTWLLSMTAWGAPEALTAEEIRRFLDEVTPVVEEVAGRDLERLPPLEVVGEDVLAPRLAREQAALVLLAHPDASPSHLRAAIQYSEIAAHSVVGKFGVFDRTLYVSLDGLERALAMLEELGQTPKPEALARCVLAHELTHALHAQYGVFERVATTGDLEWLLALNGVSEGHAVLVHEEVCERLGYAEAIPAVRVLLGIDGAGEGPSLYRAGVHFVQHHADQVWRVVLSPPTDTLMLYHPERYDPTPPRPFAHGSDLRDAVGSIARTDRWPRLEARVGYHGLLEGFVGVSEGARALVGLEEAYQVSAVDEDTPRAVIGVALRFTDPASAQAYVDAVGLAVESELTLIEEQPELRLEDVEKGPLEGVTSDVGFRRAWTVRVDGLPIPGLRMERLAVARGAWVVTVDLHAVRRPDRRVAQVLDGLLEQLWEDAPVVGPSLGVGMGDRRPSPGRSLTVLP